VAAVVLAGVRAPGLEEGLGLEVRLLAGDLGESLEQLVLLGVQDKRRLHR
jgi:hypothetical protein